mmetsp:Transcript_19398/g.29540  ORF Transcript_19398/g.29540 Transcript_19398/m.29540 type:complete len:1247 (-) Transcript_19398:127-3867(-)|eukprot:CAMPEP_0194208386 /NCGR_PEP_ID=MMETSP0156-20130528/6845_1 /TAXON_ID=33649 /ORGANISM="Thalassionema nitzschioides, Strain L26-B" /LENGTH=1246 /DNA_ID=CAMNT_0038935337 /DNA_START=1 /DNA_END=3741 /DNA_ORIENTATION=-
MVASEDTPLLGGPSHTPAPTSRREKLYAFLEGKTPVGAIYESFTIFLIILNVVSFILASLFVEKYNDETWAREDGGICGKVCDGLWFGNYDDNILEFLNIGSTSVLEIVTVAVFSMDYLLRVNLADLENPKFKGFWGKIRYLPTFFSIVDLASTVPFYVDSFILRDSDLVASQFLRMFRLFRMMRVEGRYDTALTMFDDVIYNQREILGTALFVGVTTWTAVSSLYYLVERRSTDMIYCGAGYCPDIDTGLCNIDYWGFTNCTAAGCPPTDDDPEPCYNLYRSIPSASYYSLLNLFGEFPLIDQHSLGGKVVGTFVSIIAVAIFAIPTSIIGNGFEDIIYKRHEENLAAGNINDAPQHDSDLTLGFLATETTVRGRWFNFLHARSSSGSVLFDIFINILILGTVLSFMVDTISNLPGGVYMLLDIFEFLAVIVFTAEYLSRLWSSKEDPKYAGRFGYLKYMMTFQSIVDLLTVIPYWLEVAFTGRIVTPTGDTSTVSILVKSLRLLRLLRFERYTHAFTTFDDVISENIDILAVTGFSAVILWIFFAAILYFSERDNPDEEMAENYKTIPDAMWMTLLNLTGESPLAMYSTYGKIITGILGLAATGLFGIPIGVLGAGFETLVEERTEETPDEEEEEAENINPDFDFEIESYKFVNGIGSTAAKWFEISIFILIAVSVTVGIIQTVEGLEDAFGYIEWFAVIVFTIEYVIRFVGVPADPLFDDKGNWLVCRLRFLVSFYSIIDLLAIVPFYIAAAAPDSWVNDYDEMFRILRLLRLVKLDKYIPSITLIDDVIRLKRESLKIAGYAAITLWVIFAGLLYLTENKDYSNEIDNVPFEPTYSCDSDCTMSDRFQNFFDSMFYTGVHLTGDYPITTYTWPARFVNFFMVIAAVGVVSIPSGLLANGFMEIVASKSKMRKGELTAGMIAGDDWYEARLRGLKNVDPPPSRFGPTMDKWQIAVNEFLNGKEDGTWSTFATTARVFIFTVIILNVVAVLVESIPEVDSYVGNEKGNFFDNFEVFSVTIFAIEYILRLFCAPKNKEALYSSFIYATTFFGIVDFLSTAPWFVQQAVTALGWVDANSDAAMIFRIFRIFRMLQLEDFITAFSKLDNVFRASKDVMKATGLLALIIWVGCGALFYLFEENNPNFRTCDPSVPEETCYSFESTAECDMEFPGLCSQDAFTSVPNALYYTAVFLGGEWGVIDFTWPGRFVCLFLCVAGIAMYAIPIGILFDSFGVVLGIGEDEDEES